MEKKLLVCHRTQTKADGGKFDRYFCYELDSEGNIVVNPATGKGKGIKAKIFEGILTEHSLTPASFPLVMKVDDEATLQIKDKEGNDKVIRACKLKIDRDANGNPRLDKYGKRHLVCVINQVLEVSEAPNREITWDDVMDFE